MNKERINLIIKNIEFLIENLKKEIEEENDALISYNHYKEKENKMINDYDEVFYDDEVDV